MVEGRSQCADEALPQQPDCQDLRQARAAERRREEEGVQDGTSQVQEVPQVTWQSVIAKQV